MYIYIYTYTTNIIYIYIYTTSISEFHGMLECNAISDHDILPSRIQRLVKLHKEVCPVIQGTILPFVGRS